MDHGPPPALRATSPREGGRYKPPSGSGLEAGLADVDLADRGDDDVEDVGARRSQEVVVVGEDDRGLVQQQPLDLAGRFSLARCRVRW